MATARASSNVFALHKRLSVNLLNYPQACHLPNRSRTMNRLWKSERSRSYKPVFQLSILEILEIIPITYVDEFLLAFFFCATCLIPEDDILVPPTRLMSDDITRSVKHMYLRVTSLVLRGLRSGLPRAMSRSRSSCSASAFTRSYPWIRRILCQNMARPIYLLRLLLCPLFLDLLQFSQQFCSFVFLVVAKAPLVCRRFIEVDSITCLPHCWSC